MGQRIGEEEGSTGEGATDVEDINPEELPEAATVPREHES